MNILIVNRINNRSVGTISKKIGSLLNKQLNYNVYYYWGETDGSVLNSNEYSTKTSNSRKCSKTNLINSYLRKRQGSKQLIKTIKKTKPSIIHLHCIHGGLFDFRTLFRYFVKTQIPLVITLHDCWYFTGGCYHFITSGCSKWNNGDNCKGCPINRFFHRFYIEKKHYLLKANIVNLVVCSNYVKSVLKESFLCNFKITVIHNGINLNIFSNTSSTKDKFIFEKYKVPFDCNYIIFVSSFWHKSKGSVFASKLSKDLSDKYNILIIGKGYNLLSGKSTYVIESIDNQSDLAVFYRHALLFVNPTLEDNYPTTTLEASACGIPTVVFDVGGCKDAIYGDNGILVKPNDYDTLLTVINKTINNGYDGQSIRQIADEHFDENKCFREYISIFQKYSNDQLNNKE